MYNQTGSGKSNMPASKPEVHIAQLVDKIGTHLQRLYYICGNRLSSGTIKNVFDLTGSGQFNIAASKLELPISRLVDRIGTQFQRQVNNKQ